jgi:hypothetical protein
MRIRAVMALLLIGFTGAPIDAGAGGLLDLSVSYTADSVIGAGAKARAGHLWRTPQALRHEWIEAGQKRTVIVRLDRGLAWTLLPGTNIALETTLDGLGPVPIAALADGSRLRQTAVGQETIEGIRTTKYRVSTAPGEPNRFDGNVWSSAEGIVMKIEGTGEANGRQGNIDLAFHNVRIGRFDPGLFELPANAQRMKVKGEDAQAMIEMFSRFGRGKLAK